MIIKRRQFLALSSLSLGFALLGNSLFGKRIWGAGGFAVAATPEEEALIANLRLGEPILRFVAVADTGTGGRGQYAVARAMTRYREQNPFDLVILAGDNIYNRGEIEKIGEVFEQPYKPLLDSGVKFYACLGNHDIRTGNGDAEVRYAGFNMQGRYYTFRRDKVQFFALDTNPNADWKAQLAWLDKELSRSDAPWKIVFGHHPAYSAGLHGGSKGVREALAPLFQKYGVHLYINGHDHNYERTRSINGTTYLTCGAGANIRPVGRSEVTARSASQLSFAALDVYAGHIVIAAIDTDNEIFDQGVILLQPA
jgi:3',5'-cyclic AMP phosphodiesterase CpdA